MTAPAAVRSGDARRLRPGALLLPACAVLLLAAVLGGLGHGAVGIAPAEALAILGRRLGLPLAPAGDPVREMVLLSLRLPRVCLGIAVGAALAVCGACMQGLFRNPLADPGLIGVSTGAALAAAVTIVLGEAVLDGLPPLLSASALPVAAFPGGLGATVLVYRIASRDGRTEVATLLLPGIALNALAGAALGLLVFVSDDRQLRDLQFWLLGSLGGVGWDRLLPALPLLALPTLLLLAFARPLNALLLGELEALHLGFDVERCKRAIVVLAACAVGAAVALSGVIGFVGLVVPHLVRLLAGPDHRLLLPASALLGAALLVGADLLARTVVLPAELPIGILTSCVGGPFFLWLLMRRRDLGLW